MEVVQICLQEDAYEHEDKTIKLLNTVFSTQKSFEEIEKVIETEYNIPMNNKWGEEVRQMCNLSEGIEKKGIEKGIQQGIQQGIEKQKQEMYHTFSIMLENGTPLEQILKALDYPDDFKIWLS